MPRSGGTRLHRLSNDLGRPRPAVVAERLRRSAAAPRGVRLRPLLQPRRADPGGLSRTRPRSPTTAWSCSPDGRLDEQTSDLGWAALASPAFDSLVTDAHAAKDQVLLTVFTETAKVIASIARRPEASGERLAAQLQPLLADDRLDGVDVDVEGSGKSDRAGFVAFMRSFTSTSAQHRPLGGDRGRRLSRLGRRRRQLLRRRRPRTARRPHVRDGLRHVSTGSGLARTPRSRVPRSACPTSRPCSSTRRW